MASFSDCPLEVAAEIIATLDNQDDLKACSLTCRSLLPLCRAFIFGYIEFSIRGHIISFGRLLDSNPSLSDYVRNLVYEIRFQDCDDDNVSRILKQFRRLHSFCLIGDQENHTDWDTLPQPFLDSLLHITLLPSITSLEIFCFKVFPITLFSLCPNLTSLALSDISDDSVVEYKSILNKVPQLSSLELDLRDSKLGKLVGVDQSNGFPVFDIFNLRSLSVFVEEDSDLAAFHALLNATNKLETLEYIVWGLQNGFAGLAASMNPASLSTLRKLDFNFDINEDKQDPLCGLGAELVKLSGINKFEEIILGIQVQFCPCKTGEEWGTLDAALATGFPMLKRVSIDIIIYTHEPDSNRVRLKKELDRLPKDQFPRLSTNSAVSFNFSTEVPSLT